MSGVVLPTDAGAAADMVGRARLVDTVGVEEIDGVGRFVVSQCRLSYSATNASAHPATRLRRVKRGLNPLAGAGNASPHQSPVLIDRQQLDDNIKARSLQRSIGKILALGVA